MKKPYFAFLLSILLLFGTIQLALGQMMPGAGVAKGYTFTYSYTCYFLSNDPNAVAPSEFSWINQTDYYRMNITGVSGSEVNFGSTFHMLNGSNIIAGGSMNIGSGMSSISGYNPMGMNTFYFMSSNVGMMGRMFPSSSVSPTVNDTLMMSYAGGQRLTNHLFTIANQNSMMNQSDYYFDQATGAMVEWRNQNIQTNGNLQTNSTQMMKLTSSSVWAVPEFPIFAVIPFLCIMTALALVVEIRKKKVKVF